MSDAAAIIGALLQFQWEYKGYGRYTCRSCGAEKTVDHDTGRERRESCSRSCPWRIAEEWMAESPQEPEQEQER